MIKSLVSIIIPVYKVEQYLGKCVDSVLNQTYKNIEVILVDDGSPDNCPQICDEYAKKDERIKVIHQANGGLSAARNAGIDIAKGEFICFIDSDDLISYDYVNAMLNVLKETNGDIAECDTLEFFDENEINNFNKLEDDSYKVIKTNEMQKRIYGENHNRAVIVCNKLYKTSLFKGIRFPIGKLNEDTFTTYKIYEKAENIVILSNALYYIRTNPNSITRSKFNIKRFDVLDALEEAIEYYCSKNKTEVYNVAIAYYFYRMRITYVLYRDAMKKDNEIEKKYFYDKIKMYYKIYKKLDDTKYNKLKNFLFAFSPSLYYLTYKIKNICKRLK